MPKIIILVATFNRQDLVRETLASIAGQTFSDYDCIVIDDNSTDETPAVVRAFCETDQRFSFYTKPRNLPRGLPSSRNFGLDLVKDSGYEGLQFFDDDDVMHPEKLAIQYECLHKGNLDVVLCGSQSFRGDCPITYMHVDLPKVKELHDSYLTGKINFVAQVPLFNKKYIADLRFDESLAYAEEWEFFVRLFYKQKPRFAIIDQVLFYRRKHAITMMTLPDTDFEKRKSAAVVRIKIAEFLTQNDLHTKRSLIFLTNNFLLGDNRLNIVDQLIAYASSHEDIQKPVSILLRLNKMAVHLFRKSIFKISSWV